MRKIFFLLNITFYCVAVHSQEFQLAPPLLECSSAYFSKSTTVRLNFNEPGTTIHYTLNGTEPTEQSPVYKGLVTIKKNVSFRAKCFNDLYQPSPVVALNLIKTGLPAKTMTFTAPNEKYTSSKQNILYDAIAGITGSNNGNWLGYNKDSAVVTIELKKKSKVKKILLDLLQDQGSWIFLPEKIRFYAYDDAKAQYMFLSEKDIDCTAAPGQCVQFEIATDRSVTAKQFKVVMYPLKKIPDWHVGKGNAGWLFIDEINVY